MPLQLAPTPDEKPAPRHAASWLDAFTASSLQLVADSVTQLVGFSVAYIAVARDDGNLYMAAVAGSDEARELLADARTPIAGMLEELTLAEDWGHFKWLPFERLQNPESAQGWVPTFERIDAEDAWHPLDLLIAPLYDGAGRLRGALSVDMPRTGRRPDAHQRELLERHAEHAGRAIVLALERERLAEHVRLADAARRVVRRASRAMTLEGAVRETGGLLLEAFGLVGMWAHISDTDMRPGFTLTVGDFKMPADAEFESAAARAFPRLWAEKRAAVVGLDQIVSNGQPDDIALVRRYLQEAGHSSVLYTPLAAGETLFGSLALVRGADAAPWSQGEVAAAFDLGRDLGRILLTNEAFEREQELAQELRTLDAYKSLLISTVSHELKNPLASILGNLELLSTPDVAPERASRAIRALHRGTQRMVQILGELRELSDAAVSDEPPALGPVDLVEVANGVLDLMGAVAEQRRLELVLDTDGPAIVAGDAHELDRLVVNLVSNAVKYTPDEGVITVTLRPADESRVLLEVADTGIGIGEADQRRLFDQFFRSENPSARTLPGTGLGLSIVERIVGRHGGEVGVRSELGEGSTFSVLLPAARGSRE